MTLQATFAATLVDEWARCGITDAVVAPGSRSTPLAVALAADGRVRIHMVVDERSAGFVALGLGLATGRPALVLTTSGTAAVNLHPAVVESHHARVPMIACTADRPAELHHVGAPQTIDQHGLFGVAVRWAVDPGVPEETSVGTWRSLACRVVAEAVAHPAGPGPVHLNLAFREPLVGDAGPLPPGRPGGRAWHRRPVASPPPPPEVAAELCGYTGRGVIVAGGGAGDPAAVHLLADALGWPVLADPRSGCRVPAATTVATADALLRVEGFAGAHRPEVVLRLGAPWASRVVEEWLRGLDVPQFLVDPHGAWADAGRSAWVSVAADPSALALAVVGAGPSRAPADWLAAWAGAEAAAQAALDEALAALGRLTEPYVARRVVAAVPDGGTLVVSSSMPVRDVEWYGRPRHGLRVVANRGANGIDGVTSTAVGVARAGAGPTVALLGDLAFLHDTTGLRAAAGPAVDLTLVVVDNDGGGIFSFLPQADRLEAAVFERLLATPHGLDLVAVASAMGVPAERVKAPADLDAALAAPPAGARVLVVTTDRHDNVAVHDGLHRAVAAAIRV